jgi:hypothetical protein
VGEGSKAARAFCLVVLFVEVLLSPCFVVGFVVLLARWLLLAAAATSGHSHAGLLYGSRMTVTDASWADIACDHRQNNSFISLSEYPLKMTPF